MKNFPKKCVVDTNVPIIANLATGPDAIPQDRISCVIPCIEAIDNVVKNGGLVIDDGNEIFDEYLKHLSLKGQPGQGDKFIKWVHDHRYQFPDSDRIRITKNGESYDEFPTHIGLNQVDRSDRKFIAVANAHPEKPPILEATDSKWWGWKDALSEVGITVRFLCPEYVKKKYSKQTGP